MSTDARTILVVDTQSRDWSDELSTALGEGFEVILARDPNMGFASFRSLRPWSVVMRLELGELNGLQLGRMLRHQPGGHRCLIVVHGEPSPSDRLPKAEEVKKYWPVDYFIPERDALASDIATLLKAHLRLPRSVALSRSRSASESSSAELASRLEEELSPEELSWGELVRQQVSSQTIRALLTKQVRLNSEGRVEALAESGESGSTPSSTSILTPEERDLRALTWKELLRQEVSVDSVKALLTKRIGGEPPPLVSEDELSNLRWVDLLQQEVSVTSLRALLTKDILPQRGDDPQIA